MEEITNLMNGIRGVCRPQFVLDDEIIDGLKLGNFPDIKEAKVRRFVFRFVNQNSIK